MFKLHLWVLRPRLALHYQLRIILETALESRLPLVQIASDSARKFIHSRGEMSQMNQLMIWSLVMPAGLGRRFVRTMHHVAREESQYANQKRCCKSLNIASWTHCVIWQYQEEVLQSHAMLFLCQK
jgi:hypothetical protein